MRPAILRHAYVLALVLCTCPFAQSQPAAEIIVRIDVSKTANYSIPRSIFGTFLEPIGNSTYNGLWAELLRNPSFEDSLWDVKHVAEMVKDDPELSRASEMALPLPWEPLRYAQGSRYAPQWNDAANSYRSLLLMALPDKQTGIRQKVYLPVYRVSHYVGSVYLKPISGPGRIEVSLRERNNPDHVFDRRELQVGATGWQRYEFALDVPSRQLAALEPADFVIAASDETRVLIDQASLLPGDNIGGMDPEMIALSRELKTPIVRFGGNFTSAYHWRDGVGPRDRRVSMLNTAWGIPEYNQFGTDEFLRFCQLIGAEPQIALNLGTGTPQEAAEWVEYVNGHWADHAGGLLWELGNELWGDFQIGYPTLPHVAERTKSFSDAVRKVDPKARLIATGGDPDVFQDWNAAQLTNPPDTFNYLSTHFVVTTNSVQAPHPSPDVIAKAVFALPIELERRLRTMHQQFEKTGKPTVIVPISDMTGIIEFGGIWKKRGRVFGVPAYWVFRMYSNADVAKLVETQSDGPTYDVNQGSTRLPKIADVPYLDVVSAINGSGNKLTLFCVNRHLTRDLETKINLAGFRPTNATARSIFADSIYEKNDETEPEHIHPRATPLSVESAEFKHTFRHESVTVIELGR